MVVPLEDPQNPALYLILSFYDTDLYFLLPSLPPFLPSDFSSTGLLLVYYDFQFFNIMFLGDFWACQCMYLCVSMYFLCLFFNSFSYFILFLLRSVFVLFYLIYLIIFLFLKIDAFLFLMRDRARKGMDLVVGYVGKIRKSWGLGE